LVENRDFYTPSTLYLKNVQSLTKFDWL